jgi:hypothetical protein
VTPSITASGDTADCFNSASVALKVANNGASAPSSIHVAKIIHESFIGVTSPRSLVVQFPTTGNLRIANLWPDGCPNGGPGCVTGVTSSDGCAWTLHQDGGPGTDEIWVAQNCAPCPSCTISLVFTGSNTLPEASFRLFDVTNAAASSYQNGAGGDSGCGTTVDSAPGITPSGTSSGLAIAEMANGNGPVTGFASGAPSGATFDLWTFAGQTDMDVADSADAVAHYYFSTAAAQSWNWAKTNGGDYCSWAAAIFK